MLTPEEFVDLRAKAQAATPGPWAYREDKAFCDPDILEIHSSGRTYIASFVLPLEAAYIAAANPATVLKLLDMVERLEKEADFLTILLIGRNHIIGDPEASLAEMKKNWREYAREAVEDNASDK